MQEDIRLNKLRLEDKKIFDEAYSKLKFPLAEHSFSWIYLWEGCYKDIEWAEINGNLCLFVTFDKNRYVSGPIIPGSKLSETLEACQGICEKYNKEKGFKNKFFVRYIPEDLVKTYSSLKGFELKEQFNDYLYKAEDIIGLKGRKYSDKRNKRNYFMKNYNFRTEDYSKDKHEKGCTDLLDRWKRQKKVDKEDREKLEEEVKVNKKALGISHDLGVRGMVVLVDDKVEGYIFGERTNGEICTLFFGKTNLEIKGLSQFIYSEFLKRFFPDCELVNDGEDWDVKYLESSKLSYKPYIIKKSYMLEKE